MFANKRRLLEKRKELDLKTGGRLTPYYRASCVFSLMEMARALFVPGVRKAAALREMREYAADPVVRAAFAGFPLSLHRPLASLLAAAGKIAFAGTQPLLRSSSSLR